MGMSSRKRLLAVQNIFLAICMFATPISEARDREYRVGDTEQLLGFPKLEHELAINPCLNADLIRKQFGETGIKEARENLKHYPAQLCENKAVLLMLSNWNYNASALLANTERPFILGREIAIHQSQLKQCKTLECYAQRLPRMYGWSKTTLSRTPVASRDVDPLSMGAAPIEHPKLALRGLKLPLTRQQETCGSDDLSALKFAASSLVVADRALAVVTCKSEGKKGIWLLERNENVGGWKEILELPGIENVSILPHNRELHPHIFYKEKKENCDLITILRYSEEHGYQKRLQFNLSADAYGLAHAFDVQVF